MRNGNLKRFRRQFKKYKRSYRTYEEWKLYSSTPINLLALGSYRTYEEWKLGTIPSSVSSTSRSYRTYEEWKRTNVDEYFEWWLVLTVPMRNGNFNSSNVSRIELLFLPYL